MRNELAPPAPPRRFLNQALLAGLFAVSGAAVGGLSAKFFPLEAAIGEHHPGKVALIGLALWAVFASLLFHELGHVVAGLAVGFRFMLLAVGPLWVERSSGRLRVRLNRLPSTWGGLAACVPSPSDSGLARKMAMMALGGPAASLLIAAASAGLLAGTEPSSLALSVVRFVLAVLALTSAFIFAATGFLPSGPSGFANDGERARRLLAGDSAATAEAALLALTGQAMARVRPRDWSPELVDASLLVEGKPMFAATAHSMAALARLDRGDERAALEHTEVVLRMLADVPPLAQHGLKVSAAHVLALHGHAERAAALLVGTDRAPLVEAHDLSLARAAVAAARGQVDEAVAHARRGLEEWPRARFMASEAEREWLERIAMR